VQGSPAPGAGHLQRAELHSGKEGGSCLEKLSQVLFLPEAVFLVKAAVASIHNSDFNSNLGFFFFFFFLNPTFSQFRRDFPASELSEHRAKQTGVAVPE